MTTSIIVAFCLLLIPLYASIKLNYNYSKYRKIKSKNGLTGYDVAKKILDKNGLSSIYIISVPGKLTDAYDSNRKTLRLSEEVYKGDSIASVAVAAHESGHALQDATQYKWFMVRHKIYPVVSIGEKMAMWVLIIGLILKSIDFIYAAVALMGFALAFEVITLPVELDASKRALKLIQEYDIVEKKELDGAKKMLKSAAFTYVAAILATLGQMLYYLASANSDRRK